MASFGIIRVQKFKMTDVQGIQKHNQRQGISKSNLDIDYEKSDENYDLLNDEKLKYESEIKQQISERVKRKTRANSVVLSEFLVTASPEFMNTLSDEEQKKYFEKSLSFLQERYGKQNTLYAVVHRDEKNPHMHVGVIPITEDNRLSAKDIFNRVELQQLQDEFPKQMQQHGFKVERGKSSDKKHLTPQEYKEKMELEKDVSQLKQQKEKELADIKIFKKPKEILEKVERTKKKATFSDRVTLPSKEYEKLKEIAVSSVKTKNELDKLRNQYSAVTKDLESKIRFSKNSLAKMEHDNLVLAAEKNDLTKELKQSNVNLVLAKSILKDTNKDLAMSETEKKGRLIIYNLENGHEPQTRSEAFEWLSVLEDNKRAETIPLKRLEGFLERLKEFLDKTLEKVNDFSLRGLKTKNNVINHSDSPKRKKTRDFER